MSYATTALLGAISGCTIFLGLPIARLRGVSRAVQGFLNALATGILVFLLWDILSHASAPVEQALGGVRAGRAGAFALLLALFIGGIAVGLLSLVYLNRRLSARLRRDQQQSSPRRLAMMIAGGLGLHNLSEGLAIGQAAATGALAFAGVLVVGFALHNITEGFGIAAPLASAEQRPSWAFLGLAGLIGGGPTFIGTLVGYLAVSTAVSVTALALAAGALLWVLNELFNVGRKLNTSLAMAWGLLTGFLAAYATDLFLTYLAA